MFCLELWSRHFWLQGILFRIIMCFLFGFIMESMELIKERHKNMGAILLGEIPGPFSPGSCYQQKIQRLDLGKASFFFFFFTKLNFCSISLGLPWWPNVKNHWQLLLANAGVSGSISEVGRSPGRGNGNLLQYSFSGNSMDRGTWWATVRGVAIESDMN